MATQLTPNEFVLMGAQRRALGIRMQGVVLVLFHINSDANCASFMPVFNSLMQQERRIGYATADVYANGRQIINWARGTTTPITAVPLLILYVDGRPRAKYSGQKDVASLRQFIVQATSQVTQQAQARPQAPQQAFMPQAQASPAQPGGLYGGAPAGSGGGYMPDQLGNAPNLSRIIRGGGPVGGVQGMAEEEEDQRLMIPESVTPHNTPWEILE